MVRQHNQNLHIMTVKTVLLGIALIAGAFAHAQDNGYRFEAGLGGGASFYMGDANRRLYSNSNGAAALMLRYNVNPRFSTRATLSAAGLSGDSRNAFGQLPLDEQTRFSRSIYELSVQAEWGFLAYSPLFSDEDRLAPYGLAGIGAAFMPEPATNDWALCLPIGLGIRYRLAPRVTLGLEWSMRFTGSDRLDVTDNMTPGLEDPMSIKGKGIKNKDSYSLTMLYLSFDVFEKPCNCNDEHRR